MKPWRTLTTFVVLSLTVGVMAACTTAAPDPTPSPYPTPSPTPAPTATPQPALPFLQEEVRFENGNISLAGTLTLPPTEGPRPAVILVSGSGPLDRDAGHPPVPGYFPNLFLAKHLAREGIAVLRYDERGVGQSTGEHRTATTADLSTDTEAAFEYLIIREDINSDQVGILGHSEGAWIAAMVAARNREVAFVVSMGGHAVDGYTLLLTQVRRTVEAAGPTPDEVEGAVAAARAEYDLVVAQDWEALEDRIRAVLPDQLDAMPPEQREPLGDREQIIAREMAALQTWALYFMTHDPAEDWARVTAPVLALFGELDTQVDMEQNRPPLEAALAQAGNRDKTVVVFPTGNHLFQEAVTGGPQEYAELKPEFLPGFLETISGWMLERVVLPAPAG